MTPAPKEPLSNDYVHNYYDAQVGALSGSYTAARWELSAVRRFEYRQTEAAVRAALSGKRYRKALEIGPGDAVWTKLLCEYVDGPLHLVEQSGEMLAKAKQHLAGISSITFEHADFQTSNPSAGNDLIVAMRCFEYFDDKPEALRKIKSLLAPGGRLVLVTKNPKLLTSRPVQGKRLHSDQVSVAAMQKLASDAGFSLLYRYPAVVRWFASFLPMRWFFTLVHGIMVKIRGAVVVPGIDPYAVESYTYVFTVQ